MVHGGDLLYRSKVPSWLVTRAMEPLFDVADLGVPVFIVPGNHERSRLPYPLLTCHPGVHIFDRPRSFSMRLEDVTIALSGFPFTRRVAGDAFTRRLEETGWRDEASADIRLLCIHQAIEGARVGAQDFTFRSGPDVIAGADIPPGLSALLSGHLHRAQVLSRDLAGRALAAPVIYPGSTERTSIAERHEPKGYSLLEWSPGGSQGQSWQLLRKRFVPLPIRPMVLLEVDVHGLRAAALRALLCDRLEAIDADAIVKLRAHGSPQQEAMPILSAPSLRALAPATMNIDLSLPHSDRYGTLSGYDNVRA